jgi:hypothetical protein
MAPPQAAVNENLHAHRCPPAYTLKVAGFDLLRPELDALGAAEAGEENHQAAILRPAGVHTHS